MSDPREPLGPNDGANGEPIPPVTRSEFERRAPVALVLLTAFVGAGLVMLDRDPGPEAPAQSLLIASTIGWLGSAVGLVLLARAMTRVPRHPWAPWASAIVLGFFAITGLIGAITELLAGRVPIPVVAIAALWAWRSKGRPPATARARANADRAGWGLIALVVAGVLGPDALAVAHANPGLTPLAVGSNALDLRLEIECPAANTETPLEARIIATASWLQRDPFPDGPDFVALAGSEGWYPRGGIGLSERATLEERELNPGLISELISELASFFGIGREAITPLGFRRAIEPLGSDPYRASSRTWLVEPGRDWSAEWVADLSGQSVRTAAFKLTYGRANRWVKEELVTCSW